VRRGDQSVTSPTTSCTRAGVADAPPDVDGRGRTDVGQRDVTPVARERCVNQPRALGTDVDERCRRRRVRCEQPQADTGRAPTPADLVVDTAAVDRVPMGGVARGLQAFVGDDAP
jgi:hypothetical protein